MPQFCWKTIKRPVRKAAVYLLMLALLAGCDKLTLNTATPLETLQELFVENNALKQSGWSLRTIYEAEEQLYVILEFPPAGGPRARRAPIFSELVRICPVAGVDEYWNKPSARPFMLYLSKPGHRGAIMMARCLASFDERAYDLAAGSSDSAEPKYLLLPPENADLDQIERSNASGSPSFNEAVKALYAGNVLLLQKYLNERPELVHLYSPSGHTLLFSADSPEEVTVLIAYGANPNVKVRSGGSALDWLSQFGKNTGAVKKLIEMGAAVESVEPAYAGSAKMAEILLEHGVVITNNSLYKAIRESAFDVAEVLYQNGARLDQTTFAVDRLLHTHVSYARSDTEETLKSTLNQIKALLKYEADVNELNDSGLTPLDIAQQQDDWFGKAALIDLLVSHGAVSSKAL